MLGYALICETMTKKAPLQESILKYLYSIEGNCALTKPILEFCRSDLKRASLQHSAVNHALRQLEARGKVEKVPISGHFEYRLTKQERLTSAKNTIIGIIGAFSPAEVAESLDSMSSRFNVPHFVAVRPPKPADESPKFLGKDPLGEEWSDVMEERSPNALIVSSILADYVNLKPEARDRIAEFLGWAIWTRFLVLRDGQTVGRKRVKGINDELDSWASAWRWQMNFVNKSKDAKLTSRWAATKERSREANQFTKALIRRKNLASLITALRPLTEEDWHKVYLAVGDRVEELQGLYYRPEESLEFALRTISSKLAPNFGLRVPTGVLSSILRFILFESSDERFLPGSTTPILHFTRDSLGQFHQLNLDPINKFPREGTWNPPRALKVVDGDLATSRGAINRLEQSIEELWNLITRRSIAIVHLWNFPQIDIERRRSEVLGEFDRWMKATENLDQVRLPELPFGFVGSRDILRAWRKVRREELPGLVSTSVEGNIMNADGTIRPRRIESNVLAELHEFHYRGKEPEFWHQFAERTLLVEKRREAFTKDIVVNGLRREVEFWKQRTKIDDELLAYLVGRHAKLESDVELLKEPGMGRNLAFSPKQWKRFLKIEQDFRKLFERTGKWPSPGISLERENLAVQAHLDGKWTPYLP